MTMDAINSLRASMVELHEVGKTNSEIRQILKENNVTKKFIWNTVNRYIETGDINDKPSSGCPIIVRTPEVKGGVPGEISATTLPGACTLYKMVKDKEMAKSAMERVMEEDLGLKAYKKVKVEVHSKANRTKRRGQKQDSAHKSSRTAQLAQSSIQTRRSLIAFFCKNIKELPMENRAVVQHQKPASFMIWAGILPDGKKTPLVFVPEGVKITQKLNRFILKGKVMP